MSKETKALIVLFGALFVVFPALMLGAMAGIEAVFGPPAWKAAAGRQEDERKEALELLRRIDRRLDAIELPTEPEGSE